MRPYLLAYEHAEERRERAFPYGGGGVVSGGSGAGGLRLLPWAGPDGQRCYVSADDGGGYVSRLADRMEEIQLDTGAESLGHATALLGDTAYRATVDELRFCAQRLTEALRDALRVAESRGARIDVDCDCDCDEGVGVGGGEGGD
ncbi:hypothetical protein [Streptomyces sp. NPDC048638]|uniref:hypothetical protein n=1 Tax=Streptomyces sp. NPDC048638 TaxID=3365580 RepID=UPI0037149BF5